MVLEFLKSLVEHSKKLLGLQLLRDRGTTQLVGVDDPNYVPATKR